jgi:hypothetical protein
VLPYNRAVGWEQVITIVATVVLAVLVAVLYNNRRFDDVNGVNRYRRRAPPH